MIDSIYSPAPPPGLIEALDLSDRPLCLLPDQEILRQNLPHRSVAVLAMALSGSILLAETPSGQFDTTIAAPLAAGASPSEYAQELLADRLGFSAPVSQIMTLRSGCTILSIFVARFSLSLLKAIVKPQFLLTDDKEILELAKRDLISRLVLKIMERLPNP